MGTPNERIRLRLADEIGRLDKQAPFTVALLYPSPYAAAMSSLAPVMEGFFTERASRPLVEPRKLDLAQRSTYAERAVSCEAGWCDVPLMSPILRDSLSDT